MPGRRSLIIKIAESIFESSAFNHSSLLLSRKLIGGGPLLLFIRISASGQLSISFFRPSSLFKSATVIETLFSSIKDNSSKVSLRDSSPLAFITTETPSIIKLLAHAFPKPLEEAHTIAFLFLMPKSIINSKFY